MAEEMRKDVMENIQVGIMVHLTADTPHRLCMWCYCSGTPSQDYLATQMQLLVETTGTKVLRSGGGT